MCTEERVSKKIYGTLGKTPSQGLAILLQVYGDNTMLRSRIFQWHKRFKEVHEEVKNGSSRGKPSISRSMLNM